ncbi:protein-L-isoaspartate O-methyltransferase [mine drainage metagenome]|uniref:protein-L-isoaspartate(D-aspartate) O-methyltransferase n=1 Tax=mine drainage metagenome TaxID=410659 RepID=A0A1J5RMD2_9ZZZZ
MSMEGAPPLGAYAEEVAVLGGLSDPALLRALLRVDRAAFLPPPPWLVEHVDGGYYLAGPERPQVLRHAVAIALDPSRRLNSGNPARIARFIEALAPKPGETLLHVGAGLGYYSALLAEMTGGRGRVIAAEIDPVLAASARQRLAPWPQVEVTGDALALDPPALDGIFVSAGLAHLPPAWLAALRPGGRMVVPLTGSGETGFVFLLSRGDDPCRWQARMLSAQKFYSCQGGVRGETAVTALDRALADPMVTRVRALRLDRHAPGPGCWLHGDGWCLSV